MSAVAVARPFVTGLRTPQGKVVSLGNAGGERVTVRVQFEALWDAIAVDVSVDTPVQALASASLESFGMGQTNPADFVVKLNGWEVKGAEATVRSSGARNGSTFLVAHRFRRPIR